MENYREQAIYSDGGVKQDKRDNGYLEDRQENDLKDGKPTKHRRNYQACEPCRERKVKCMLGDVDNPSKGPCAKCARESKECWFRETRKKDANINSKSVERPAKRPRTDSSHSERTVPTVATANRHSPITTNGYTYNAHSQSPSRYPPVSSPTSIASMSIPNMNNYMSQPRSTPTQMAHTGPYPSPQSGFNNAFSSNTPATRANEDDHVVMPQAHSLSQAFTNTTDNLSVLVRAATTTDMGGDPVVKLERTRALTGSTGEIDNKNLSPEAVRIRQKAREVWSQMRSVRAGWFSADEALGYVEYFYTHLAPMTPVVTQEFANPATHKRLLTEEPILALTILAISSRYCDLKTPSKKSRGFYIHEHLWVTLRKIIQRLLWGQEQFGGGFTGAGMVPTQETATGQITWKGSLRTLGTIEALLLLTDWQPRALHFPPGDDENKLVGAGLNLLEDDRPRSADTGIHVPHATWLEPAWRSDRMSSMLLALAQSLSFELGVFDTRHERCGRQHGQDSDCMRLRRLRRLVITYVAQISGRIGIQASLTPAQDTDPSGPNAFTPTDIMQKLWYDIAHIMFDANRDIFPSREHTQNLVETGEYKNAIGVLRPRLDSWYREYTANNHRLHPSMVHVLRMEYEYARLYIHSLALQKVIGHMVMPDTKPTSQNLTAQLVPVAEENKEYIDEVRTSAMNILEVSCYEVGDKLQALGHAPVRTFLRTLSALMFALKLFILGSEAREVSRTFKLLKEMTNKMIAQNMDDVHLSPHAARMVQQIMSDVQTTMVRIPKPGSRGHSRHISPQPHHALNGSLISDQESPDGLSSIPMGDFHNQTFMMPTNFDLTNFDTNMNFDGSVDPNLFAQSGDDWISMPLDNLFSLDTNTVNQGFGGIGPTFGDRDMLSVITGSQLDQNSGPISNNSYAAIPPGF